WFDRVESQVMLESADKSFKGQIMGRVKWAVGRYNERRLLRGADLALLHGRTVYERLAPLSQNPHLVEDIHLTESDRIRSDRLARKIAEAGNGPLKIVYAGRATAMKGVLDWVDVVAVLAERGVDVHADWLGDGDQLDAMKARARDRGVADRIVFHGFVAERDRVLEALREAYLLLFCHLTDESPRILIEALHAGTPLVGYDDPFARSLVDENGAGQLFTRGDIAALSQALAELAQDRSKLQDLISRAAASAFHLTREQVFRHRSEIIKAELPPNPFQSSA
ncbi:MAG: glycosyltransferase, partial [Pseudomonadota bacterium]